MKKDKSIYCNWEFSHESNSGKPHYVKCKNCGRIKRSDLPDIQPCSGSNAAYQTMIKKILGQDLEDKDIQNLEDEEERVLENEEGEE